CCSGRPRVICPAWSYGGVSSGVGGAGPEVLGGGLLGAAVVASADSLSGARGLVALGERLGGLPVHCDHFLCVSEDLLGRTEPFTASSEGEAELSVEFRLELSGAGKEAEEFRARRVLPEPVVRPRGVADLDEVVGPEDVDVAIS